MHLVESAQGGTTLAIAEFDRTDAPAGAEVPELVNKLLSDYGAALLRGLDIAEPEQFRRVVGYFGGSLLDYRHGNSPRTAVTEGVYTSTEYPAAYDISLHSEMSYSATWPERLFFCCLRPADTGGQTHLSDSAYVLRSLSDPVRERFLSKNLVYRQNLPNQVGMGKSWQQTYESDSRSEVARYLAAADIEFAWLEDGSLRTWQSRPASLWHQVRGLEVWFNQADQWHPSNLPASEARALRELFDGDDELPLSVTFGDGTDIPESDLAEIRALAEHNAVDVEWCRGDLLVVDNMAMLHGRRAYTGDRKILVAMS